MAAIDSGHRADRVYQFARRVGAARLLVVKGKASCPTILGVPWRGEVVDTTGKRRATARGVPLDYVRRQLGHTSIQLTIDPYARGAKTKLPAYLVGVLDGANVTMKQEVAVLHHVTGSEGSVVTFWPER